jgi:hypothetical protein
MLLWERATNYCVWLTSLEHVHTLPIPVVGASCHQNFMLLRVTICHNSPQFMKKVSLFRSNSILNKNKNKQTKYLITSLSSIIRLFLNNVPLNWTELIHSSRRQAYDVWPECGCIRDFSTVSWFSRPFQSAEARACRALIGWVVDHKKALVHSVLPNLKKSWDREQ